MGGDTAIFYGFDNALFSKSILDELHFGNGGLIINTSAKSDNSREAAQAHSINSVTNATRSNIFLSSKRGRCVSKQMVCHGENPIDNQH